MTLLKEASVWNFLYTRIPAKIITIADAIVVDSAAPERPSCGIRRIHNTELTTTPIPASKADMPGCPALLIMVVSITKRVKNPDPTTSIERD